MADQERKRRIFYTGSGTFGEGHWTAIPPLRDITALVKASLGPYEPLALPEDEALARIPKTFPLMAHGKTMGTIHLDGTLWKDMVNAGLTASPDEVIQDVLMYEWYPGGQKGHTQEVVRLVAFGDDVWLCFNHNALDKLSRLRGGEDGDAEGIVYDLVLDSARTYLRNRYGDEWRRILPRIASDHDGNGDMEGALAMVHDSVNETIISQLRLTSFVTPLAIPILYDEAQNMYAYIPRSNVAVSLSDRTVWYGGGESSDAVFSLSEIVMQLLHAGSS